MSNDSIYITRFTPEIDTRYFDCGNYAINIYLQNDAKWDMSDGICVTHVLMDDRKIVGYFAMSCAQMELHPEEQSELNGRKFVPIVEVPFLGVDKRYQGKGFGRTLVNELIATAYDISRMAGCRYIFLEAVQDRVGWYQSLGFDVTEMGRFLGGVPMRYKIPNPDEIDIEDYFS